MTNETSTYSRIPVSKAGVVSNVVVHRCSKDNQGSTVFAVCSQMQHGEESCAESYFKVCGRRREFSGGCLTKEGDDILMELQTNSDNNVSPRHKSSLSKTDDLLCACLPRIPGTQSTCSNRYVSMPDYNSDILKDQSAKFKRRADEKVYDSRPDQCHQARRLCTNFLCTKTPCQDFADHSCTAWNSDCVRQADCERSQSMIQFWRCTDHIHTVGHASRSSPSSKGHRSSKSRDHLSRKELYCDDNKFSKRLSVRNKPADLKTIKYFQTTKRSSERVTAKRSSFGTLRTKISDTPSRFLLGPLLILVVCIFNASRLIAGTIKCRISNGLPSKCVVFALWTLIILPGDSKRILGNSLLVSPGQFCARTRFLNAKQQEICQNHSAILKYVEQGVSLATHRCQREFQHNRWNCSTTPRTYYARLLNQDVRETAYVTAITSAAVTYSVTYACSQGKIAGCGCRENSVSSYDLLKAEARKRNVQVTERQLRRAAATFEWGGCGDVVEFGARVSQTFSENFGRKHQGKDLKAKIEEHNLLAGRLAIQKHMRKECRCHGITGSCTLETCWSKMPKWTDIGSGIRSHFDKAVRVQLANDGRSLLPTRKQRLALKEYSYPKKHRPYSNLQRFRRATPVINPSLSGMASSNLITEGGSETERRRRRRKRFKGLRRRRGGGDHKASIDDQDLVYSQESPNFCKRARRHGTMGTSGRRCIPNSTGAGSCDYLCCGRSHSRHQVTVTKRCNCRMEYCCKVICDECTSIESIYTCD